VNLDLALFRLINVTWGADVLAPVMKVLSNPVYWVPVMVAFVAWMLFRDGRHGRITVLVLLLLVPATDQVSSHLLKPLVHRPRPCRPEAAIADVETHGVHCSSKGSFPSSHAANIGGVALLLALRYRKWAIPAALLALGVGYSRVYLGVHYPSDVLAGWTLGAVAGWGAASLALRLDRWRAGPTLKTDSVA
jgi:membrane-associated phospholipid phosphatase